MRKAIAEAIMLTTIMFTLSDPVNRADATAGPYHAAIAAGPACGQPDDQ
jgi:hypothetical protein